MPPAGPPAETIDAPRALELLAGRLVVLATHVGGRWSHEAHSFVCQFLEGSWHPGLAVLFRSFASARVYALSLLERPGLGCGTRLPRLTSLPFVATCRSSLCCEPGLRGRDWC